MNRTIAGGRTDTKGLSEQRMCPSKLLMKWDTGEDGDGWWWSGGWMKNRGKRKSNQVKNSYQAHEGV